MTKPRSSLPVAPGPTTPRARPSADRSAAPSPAGFVSRGSASLRREALLWVAWARGAGGRWLPADTPLPAPIGPTAALACPDREALLADLARQVAACARCGLAAGRTQTVFGEGSAHPRLVVVGEAPGAEEDRTGRPFVGRAGELLTRMLAAIGLARDQVYICNVLKCRPPGNRPPRPDEAAACRPWLGAQLEALCAGPPRAPASPAPLILALGSHAVRRLLGTERGIASLRGRVATTPEGWRVLPTWHPAYLLRTPSAKREAWEDMQRVAALLGLDVAVRTPASAPAAGSPSAPGSASASTSAPPDA